jgi:ABC-type Mn2+/Zn2+ transport system permease subunit
MKPRTSLYVLITTVCTVSYLFYWNHKILNMFISPQFAQSVTCSIETTKYSICSYHHSLHSQLLVLLKTRNTQYVHINTVSSVSYLFYWNPEILIIFISPEFAQSVTCSIETPYFSLFSHHRSLHSQLLVLLLHRTAHYVHIFAVCTVSYLFYWHPDLLIMFISPEFTHSVTWCIDTSNSNFFPITRVYTDNYFFYWHYVILIMFTSPKF